MRNGLADERLGFRHVAVILGRGPEGCQRLERRMFLAVLRSLVAAIGSRRRRECARQQNRPQPDAVWRLECLISSD